MPEDFRPIDDWPTRVAQYAGLACLLEATAPKPGNVHRGADFEGLTYLDFAGSAPTIGPAIAQAAAVGRLGECVYSAIDATHRIVGTNTNLGTVLLLVPLAMVPRSGALGEPAFARFSRDLTLRTPDGCTRPFDWRIQAAWAPSRRRTYTARRPTIRCTRCGWPPIETSSRGNMPMDLPRCSTRSCRRSQRECGTPGRLPMRSSLPTYVCSASIPTA